MIFSKNRFPPFGIMLYAETGEAAIFDLPGGYFLKDPR
jgi:hypothetical protein